MDVHASDASMIRYLLPDSKVASGVLVLFACCEFQRSCDQVNRWRSLLQGTVLTADLIATLEFDTAKCRSRYCYCKTFWVWEAMNKLAARAASPDSA